MVASVDALLGAPAAPAGERSPEDLAYLFSSTGTSGLPKVAAHRHSGATAFLQMFAANPVMAFRETDSALVIVPFAHLYGTAILTHALHCGARVVVPAMEGFDVDVFLRALQDHRVTVCPLSPPAAQLLARHPAVDRFDLGAVRFLNTGAAPCPPGLEAAVEARIGCRVADTWGMTECWCPAPPADPIVHGSCGRLAPGHEARVVDPASGAGLRPGEVGELWLRGPQVMRGYVGEEAEGSPDAGGWLHTGDLCRLDDEGNLFYVDRLKDLIKVGGYSVAPAEVEAAVVTHPAVDDAAVVGRDDPHEGQVPGRVRHPEGAGHGSRARRLGGHAPGSLEAPSGVRRRRGAPAPPHGQAAPGSAGRAAPAGHPVTGRAPEHAPQLRPPRHPELGESRRQVVAHRPLGQEQPATDLAVAESVGCEVHDLALSVGQAGEHAPVGSGDRPGSNAAARASTRASPNGSAAARARRTAAAAVAASVATSAASHHSSAASTARGARS